MKKIRSCTANNFLERALLLRGWRTEVHERLGEVDHTFTCIVNGHCGNGQVRILIDDLTNEAVPFAGSRVLGTELERGKS